MNTFIQHNIGALIVLAVWELIWKGVALYKSAQHRQPYWFIAILLINSAGIFSLIYLKFFQPKKNV